ncbi:MAG: D-alanyl-D-alanine dipeptidase [Rhodospirillales bacterium]|nr:D-alanyl-D-alanine dipeptidase [Rhodospirillales bacterium]
MELVEITEEIHGVLLDLKYATDDNFTDEPVYSRAVCYLHPAAETLLVKAKDLAADMGYGLKIFDAYRPTEAQWDLWDHTPDIDFLADPRRGSPHSRGVAVDLTLLDEMGQELPMGTPFDFFSPTSHHGNREHSAEILKNRAILLGLMTATGWDCFMNEWWHYQLFLPRTYPLVSNKELDQSMMPE